MHPFFDLASIFEELNKNHFDGFLDPPVLVWNSRLKSCSGRFFPGSRKYWSEVPPKIEIAGYLKTETKAEHHIRDTMAHEMIHYWLWVRKRPYGHTAEFLTKMKEMGVSRYNPVPRSRPYRYVYECGFCRKAFPARRKLGNLACAKCCKEFTGGRYDARFRLVLQKVLGPGELFESPDKSP